MHILHINSNYLTSKLHENLINQLESKGINNTIFMPIKSETRREFLYESKNDVHTPVTFNDWDKFFFSRKQNKIYTKLKETLNVTDYNIIHAHTLFTDGNIAYQLNKDYNIPYIVTVRGHTDIENFFRLRVNLRKRGRDILREAEYIIFLSHANRDKLLKEYINDEQLAKKIIEKSVIQPNGIDDFWFENKGTPKKIRDRSKLNIIFVGKFMKRKNPLATVKALNKLAKTERLDITFTSVGQITDQNYAQKVEDEAEISFQIIPQKTVEELIEFYRKNDIYIMPSFTETFGLVYPEAMSQGLPVIYTKNQGFYQQFPEGTVGYGVDPHDANDIIDKIKLILNNYEKTSVNALNSYSKFNWKNISEEYVRLYTNLFEKRI